MGKRTHETIRDDLMQHTHAALRSRLGASKHAVPDPIKPPMLGIAFAPGMIRAIRDGTKTQTRRAGAAAASRLASPGEKMYVRERVHVEAHPDGDRYTYAADVDTSTCRLRFRPAIYMPRSAARFAIRVVELRQERLQAISVADAIAEGCPVERHRDAVEWYHALWDSLATAPGTRWCDDPIVWVIRFEVLPMPGQRLRPDSDQVPRRGARRASSRRSNQ